MNGISLFYDSLGRMTSSISYVDGIPYGEGIKYNPNGQIVEYLYQNENIKYRAHLNNEIISSEY
jgi:hypothetical protein